MPITGDADTRYAKARSVITVTPQSDSSLVRRLNRLTTRDDDYWSFRGNSRRQHGHAFLQYPAMMVPQAAHAILKKACAVHPEIEWVGDPFAGSGTVLTESMDRGLSFFGKDINPLAILLCRAKSGPFFPEALAEKLRQVSERMGADHNETIAAGFPGLDKWFRQDVQLALSQIKRAILKEDAAWARRFFWIGLAETVRLTSNSRTSTFKLHIRPKREIRTRKLNPITIFQKVIGRNIQHLRDQADHLRTSDLLRRGHYTGTIDVRLADSRYRQRGERQCDIILTSPPYGDNATTVPYGQYSYLPLRWIELTDIDDAVDPDCLRSTLEIDSRSLGGSKRIEGTIRDELCDCSPALCRYLERLTDQPPDRAKRVIAFFRDLNACLTPVLKILRRGGLMVWTLGNRKVGGKRVPLDKVLRELLAAHKATLLVSLKRRISSKRMARKNNVAETMSAERILVMRKAP